MIGRRRRVSGLTRRRAGERGTASLEVVAMAPLVIFGGLVALQVGAVGWTTVATSEAAREAARAAAMGSSAQAAADASLPGALSWRPSSRFDGSHVVLDVKVPTVLPGFSYTVTRRAVLP